MLITIYINNIFSKHNSNSSKSNIFSSILSDMEFSKSGPVETSPRHIGHQILAKILSLLFYFSQNLWPKPIGCNFSWACSILSDDNNNQNNLILNNSNSNISLINNNSAELISNSNEDINNIIHHLNEKEFTNDISNTNITINNNPLYNNDHYNNNSEIYIHINNNGNSDSRKSNKENNDHNSSDSKKNKNTSSKNNYNIKVSKIFLYRIIFFK